MFKRILFLFRGMFSCLIFTGTFLYAVGFIGNFGVSGTNLYSHSKTRSPVSRQKLLNS